MVHGSYKNTSDQSRRAFVLNAFAEGTRSGTDGEILKGVPVIKTGEKMAGKFFPLLFDPSGGIKINRMDLAENPAGFTASSEVVFPQ